MSPNPDISFLMPVFNEELNIPNVIRNLRRTLEQNSAWKWELIVIEDGSHDQTRQVLERVLEACPNTTLMIHEKNMGYTQSLKDGIAKARGKFLIYIGADEEFDCSELPSFVDPLLNDEADVILGVRWQRNAYQLFRFFLSVIYIFLLNYLFKLRVNDYNWSQGWKKELLDRIDITSHSLFVLPEIIIKAFDLNYRVKEVPSNHRGRQAGKSSVNTRIMWRALTDAFRFWRRRRSPTYSAERTTPALSKQPTLAD